MRIAFGISWNDSKKGQYLAAVGLSLGLLFASMPGLGQSMAQATSEMVSVIVRELPGSGSAPEQMVEDLGGDVGRHIGIIDGFVATVPEASIPSLEGVRHVHSVTRDQRVRLLHEVNGYDASLASNAGSIFNTTNAVKARDFWRDGYTGKGVDVAMIDTGVVPVDGLTVPGKVVNGPDLSFETNSEAHRYLDTYGHGTHMAGIIGGRDNAVVSGKENGDHDNFIGVAPDARIVNVKVAAHDGSTDVSQVLAAIDWVVQHRNSGGLNIRVLNLSFGTDGTQNYMFDPLTYAAEVAWHKGIVVVVAAGNSQFGTAALNNPAYDPYVIAVGASDTKGTFDTSDDTVPDWSARGDGFRNPDLVAPGKSVASLRAPGSFVDENYPGGRVNDKLFKGSGTSQAAAVVSGAAALVIQQRPSITPDQVKALFRSTATKMPVADEQAQGAGVLNLKAARTTPTPVAVQTWPRATGTGSLELARGSGHLVMKGPDTVCEKKYLETEAAAAGTTTDATVSTDSCRTDAAVSTDTAAVDATASTSTSTTATKQTMAESCPEIDHVLQGEKDIFGNAWDGATWSGRSWTGATWSGGEWLGRSWTGADWSGRSWTGATWSGRSWTGATWSGRSWTGATWSGATWSGRSWTGATWSGATWSGATWSGATWSGATWSGATWSGATWSGATWS